MDTRYRNGWNTALPPAPRSRCRAVPSTGWQCTGSIINTLTNRRSAFPTRRCVVVAPGLDHQWQPQQSQSPPQALCAGPDEGQLLSLAQQISLASDLVLAAGLAASGYALGGLKLAAGFVLWGVFLRVVCGWHATWLVNSATHMFGSRRWAVKDDSTNNWWVALLTGGEGWHNNHHAHPVSASTAWRGMKSTSTGGASVPEEDRTREKGVCETADAGRSSAASRPCSLALCVSHKRTSLAACRARFSFRATMHLNASGPQRTVAAFTVDA